MKITQIYSCVFAELKVNEEARKDDNALIVGVLRRLHIDPSAPFSAVMRDKRLPSLEGITRCRRKVQNDFPELKDKASAMIRDDKNRDYRKFAREGR